MTPKALLVLAQHDFDDAEHAIVAETLRNAGITALEAAGSLEVATGEHGTVIKPGLTLEQVSVGDWDAIVFIGGRGSRQYWNDRTAHRLVETAWQRHMVIGAIGSAVVTLARAGILKGIHVTVGPGHAEQIIRHEALYTGSDVEHDFDVVTADGAQSAPVFAKKLVDEIWKRKGTLTSAEPFEQP